RIGLKPGNPDGTYVQKVPLMGFQAEPQFSIKVGDRALSYNFPDDYVAVSRHDEPQVDVSDSDVVFVGYGVVAPEYGWDDYKGSWGRENFDIQNANGNADRAKVEAWMTLDRAKELFAAAGQDFDALKKTAITKDFKPVALNARATFHLKNNLRKIDSQNVVAR